MDLDDEEYYYNRFIKTHISKKELKEKYISKDKIREEIEKTEEELYNGEILQSFAYIKIETLKELLLEE